MRNTYKTFNFDYVIIPSASTAKRCDGPSTDLLARIRPVFASRQKRRQSCRGARDRPRPRQIIDRHIDTAVLGHWVFAVDYTIETENAHIINGKHLGILDVQTDLIIDLSGEST